jgi:thaumarchaeosortase
MCGLNNEATSPKNKAWATILVKILPVVAFVVPLMLLYSLNPYDPYLNVSTQYSFQLMWKGRTFQLFFIWLIALELIFSWEAIKPRIGKQNTSRLIAVIVALLLPTLYVLLENLGLNGAIANWSQLNGVAFYDSMPLAVEYIVFSVLFCLIIFLSFGKKGLVSFTLPALFVALVGVLYTIDNVFPYGTFTPFQLLVPTTATLAGGLLSLMGYAVVPGIDAATSMPTLQVTGPLGSAKFAIGWPCAGIESLLIFTAVALLFLKRMNISWKAKVGYFAFGAAVTYFINIMRIATLFTIGMQFGAESNQVQMFHFYYGPLYAMAWIVSYPLIILANQGLWRKISASQRALRKPQPKPPNPV